MNNTEKKTDNSEIIYTLFPNYVTGVILPIENYQSTLHPDEYKTIQTASDKRKYEFSTGRWCAKKALAAEGIHNIPILSGENREPIWPEGIVGSISHSKDQCGAVIARNSNISSIGFDIENIKALKNDIAKIVCTDEEKEWLSGNNEYSYDILVLLIFSLKESAYKCVFHQQQIKSGFKDYSITPNLLANAAQVTINKKHINPNMDLRFMISDTHIYTSAIYS